MHQTAGTGSASSVGSAINASRAVKAQLWWYEQIFQIEQFAQGADHLDSFFLVANRAKPLIDVPPWRRPSEPHSALNEVTGLGE